LPETQTFPEATVQIYAGRTRSLPVAGTELAVAVVWVTLPVPVDVGWSLGGGLRLSYAMMLESEHINIR